MSRVEQDVHAQVRGRPRTPWNIGLSNAMCRGVIRRSTRRSWWNYVMSAQAGIFNKAGSPPDVASIETRLASSNAAHGPDRAGRFVDPHTSMFHWARWFDSVSRHEVQPHRLATGAVLTFDGRIDNRAELVRRLSPEDLPSGLRSSDVEIAGAAYARWGLESLDLFDGDWSLALVDRLQRTLVLARDFMGIRPLYYASHGESVLWSTCFAALVACVRPDALDEDYILSNLTSQPLPEQTIYRDIRQVVAGTYVRFDAHGKRTAGRFCDLRGVEPIRCRTRADYADALRSHLRDGVAVRLRTDAPVGIKLSGGYDSSAVTCLAHELITNGEVEARTIQPVTYFNPIAPEGDERRYVACVERACGVSSIMLPNSHDDVIRSMAQRLDPFRRSPHARGLEDALGPYGVKVWYLTGEMGDLLMAKGSVHCGALLEHLLSGRIREFCRDLTLFAEVRQVPWFHALARVLEPCHPLWLTKARERRTLRSALERAFQVSGLDWPELFGVSRSFLNGAPPYRDHGWRYARRVSLPKRWLVRRLFEIGGNDTLVSPEGSPSFKVSHPFLHRPLVRFVLGIPYTELWRPYPQRALMKEALATVLPRQILTRNSKGDATPGAVRRTRAIVDFVGADASAWCLVKKGWTEESVLGPRLARVMERGLSDSIVVDLLCSLEIWLRTRTNPVLPSAAAIGR